MAAFSIGKLPLGKYVKLIKTWKTVSQVAKEDDDFYTERQPNLASLQTRKSSNIHKIKYGNTIEATVKATLDNAHQKHLEVFNKDLSEGYNYFYGKHRCELNWSSNERPLASKVKVPNYNHDLKGLQQDLMDDLTQYNGPGCMYQFPTEEAKSQG